MTSSVIGNNLSLHAKERNRLQTKGQRILSGAATFWFLVAVSGQWLMVYYILVFYGGSGLSGEFDAWDKVLSNGIIAGDLLGNIAIVAHVALAAVITFAGPLQLIPLIRQRWPRFHRWNGRVYMLTVLIVTGAGVTLNFTRENPAGIIMEIAGGINALLVWLCAGFALYAALHRQFDSHRRWALRLFVLVSASWFYRVMFMLWLTIHQAPVGHNENWNGPFDIFMAFAHILLPLAVLEIYLRAQRSMSAGFKYASAALLCILTVGMGVGIFTTTMVFWLPHI